MPMFRGLSFLLEITRMKNSGNEAHRSKQKYKEAEVFEFSHLTAKPQHFSFYALQGKNI